MSRERFDDNCKDCNPVAIDPATGKRVPDDHPVMVAMNKVWAMTTKKEREAFHEFTCHNSREPKVLLVVAALRRRIQEALIEEALIEALPVMVNKDLSDNENPSRN